MSISTSTKSNLTEELKNSTNPIHKRLEQTAFFKELANRSLPLESYVNYLQAMAGINGVLEKEILIANHPILNLIWKPEMQKLPSLLVDLESLNSTEIADIPLVVDAMLDTIKFIRLCRIEKPISLFGILYVIEGSTLGGKVLKKLVQENFQFPENEKVLYLDYYKDKKLEHWEEFKSKLNSLDLTDTERQSILETANLFFKKIESIFTYLFPIYNTTFFYNVTTLNPEAGKHNIPEDISEIHAALRAGNISWDANPYYAWRYGLRGKQYTRSDSAWLITLCDLDDDVVIDQIKWLGRILASRGMPQWLLATHLEHLVSELIKVRPERISYYEKLTKAKKELHLAFEQFLPNEARFNLILDFEKQVGIEWSNRLKNMGTILLSAICDEQSGIDRALTSIHPWVTDNNRFPQHWIEAVNTLIESTKKKVGLI